MRCNSHRSRPPNIRVNCSVEDNRPGFIHNQCLTRDALCGDMTVIKAWSSNSQWLGTLAREEAHNMLSSIHQKYCNYTTSSEWLTSTTAIALPGIIPPSSLFSRWILSELTFVNVDCVGAIYLMTVVTFCWWCSLLRALWQRGWTMHRLLWLLLFPRSNKAHHQLDTNKYVQQIHTGTWASSNKQWM